MHNVHHFTYGADHQPIGLNGYTTISGCSREKARKIQTVLHGQRWSMQYDDNDHFKEVVERYNMHCAEIVTVFPYVA